MDNTVLSVSQNNIRENFYTTFWHVRIEEFGFLKSKFFKSEEDY